MPEDVEGGKPHLDLDDKEQVKREIDRAFKMFPHLACTASSDGLFCPSCGLEHVTEIRRGQHSGHHMKSYHRTDCRTGYTCYEIDAGRGDWGPIWHENVVRFEIEGFPFYLYFLPGTHNCTGIGRGVLHWN